jgi:hypothetical protein
VKRTRVAANARCAVCGGRAADCKKAVALRPGLFVCGDCIELMHALVSEEH